MKCETQPDDSAVDTRPDLTVRRPDEPSHWMRVRPAPGLVEVDACGELLASSDRALAITEVSSRGVLDTVYYLPRGDVRESLEPLADARSHCPLKGDARYFTLDGDTRIAWEYSEPPAFAAAIANHVAFYGERVRIVRTGPDCADTSG